MRKVEVGQLMSVNGLDMEEFITWADDKYKFYDDGSANYLRPEVERWIRTKSTVAIVDMGVYNEEKSNRKNNV